MRYGLIKMDKDFHYYGTYVAARLAGYEPSESQVVAYAAQYVDDSYDEYILRKGQHYTDSRPIPTDQTWWEHLTSKEQVKRSIWVPFHIELAEKLNLPKRVDMDQKAIIEAELPADVRNYLPSGDAGHVITTTRKPNWGNTASPLEGKKESIEFLLKRTGQEDEGAADALADALGNLPLALEQAGAYIEETGISLASCLDLLNLCAFLAPDDIPKSILAEGSDHLPEPLASVVANEIALNDAVATLKRHSLLNVAGDALSVHRFVQAVTHDQLKERSQEKTWAEAAIRLVDGALPFSAYDVQTWPVCSRLLPHALAASEHAERLGAAPEAIGRLLYNVGVYLYVRADFNEAKSAYERALKIEENVYGPDHPEVAATVDNLGIVLRQMGDLEGAKEYHERALEIFEHAYGPDHPEVARTAGNLGIVLQQMGDLEGAKVHYERALEIFERAHGPDHPEVARTVEGLGTVQGDLGDLEGAKVHYERALEIFERAHGPDHPEVAATVDNLGIVLQQMGDLEGAKEYHERALEIFEHAYGPDHPEVARTVDNLGIVLQQMGDLEGAKEYHERALGEDHYLTVKAGDNLASLERED
jgi:Tfp pilus assembly protein PilF